MTTNRTSGPVLVILALALGVLGDSLFYRAGWGVNVSIWFFAAFAAVAWMRGLYKYAPLSRYVWVAVALSGLAGFRDAVTLKVITVIALLAAVAFATLSTQQADRLKQSVFTFLGRVADTLAVSVTVFTSHLPSLFPAMPTDVPVPSPAFIRALRSAGLSIIALLLFGSLLVSADAVFERIVIDFFTFDLETVTRHSGVMLLYAWLGLTLLYALTIGPKPIVRIPRGEPRTTGYAIEINSMLATLNSLFTLFVIVQVGYFFGGHESIMEEANLTYADYARRGFFEISTVAVCSFVMVLICDTLIPFAAAAGRPAFHVLMLLHLGLVSMLIASAFDRLELYIDAYGLTELRFYVAVAIGWIALAFLMLAYAVLRPNRPALPRMLVNTLFAAVFVLHIVNPAAIVVRTNVSRDNAPEQFDVEYAVSMGADAVPALVKRLSRLTSEQRLAIERRLTDRWGNRETEFRDWNLSRWSAVRAVRQLNN